MTFDINNLIDSEFKMLSKIGWLLYNREDQHGGLTAEEVYELLQIINEEEMENEYQQAYDEGFNDGAGR
ncbi:hypothetical protein [Bacillus infantis]|uniref:hypothetical protein n=1 Tax=Bacillus infantis TaxID=324767 RepID=UPI003CF9ED7A